jgi:hypothetical protein
MITILIFFKKKLTKDQENYLNLKILKIVFFRSLIVANQFNPDYALEKKH